MLSKECKVCVVIINCILSHEYKKNKICLVIYIPSKCVCEKIREIHGHFVSNTFFYTCSLTQYSEEHIILLIRL